MEHKVALVIPTTVNVDIPLSESTIQEIVNRSLRFLANLAGGATAYPATGAWVAESGKLVTEKVYIVYSFFSDLTIDDLMKIRSFVVNLKQELGQESFAVEINGKFILL